MDSKIKIEVNADTQQTLQWVSIEKDPKAMEAVLKKLMEAMCDVVIDRFIVDNYSNVQTGEIEREKTI